METNEISEQEVKTYAALSKSKSWMTNKALASAVPGVANRTVRAYTLKFVRLGIADLAEVFPAHRYRISPKARRRNLGYMIRLEKAMAVFGFIQTEGKKAGRRSRETAGEDAHRA